MRTLAKKLFVFVFVVSAAPAGAKPPQAVHDPQKTAVPPAELTPLQKNMNDLKSPEVRLRRQAAEELGRLRDSHATPALLVALSDEDVTVRASVARALGLMRSADGLKELHRVLREDPDPQVRQSAAVSLGFIADPSSAEALIKTLKDASPGPHFAACQALAALRAPSAVPALSESLSDPSSQFRRSAAQALGEIGEPSAIPALRPLLKDSDLSVRVAAVQSLGKLKDKDSVPALKKNLNRKSPPELRAASARALARQGNASGQSAALEVLSDTSAPTGVRLEAVQTLSEIGDKSLLPALKKVAEKDRDEYVKTAVNNLINRLSARP